MLQAVQRVGLLHKLGELGGAEKLLYRAANWLDINHALRGYRFLILGRHPLPYHPLHPVHPYPERLLYQLPYRTQAPVAKVLVLVELVADPLVVDPPKLLLLRNLLGNLN